eukprot:1177370-Prorocentrum_minimum.AAC.1
MASSSSSNCAASTRALGEANTSRTGALRVWPVRMRFITFYYMQSLYLSSGPESRIRSRCGRWISAQRRAHGPQKREKD